MDIGIVRCFLQSNNPLHERGALCFVILLFSEKDVTCPCLCFVLVLCLSDLVALLVVTRVGWAVGWALPTSPTSAPTSLLSWQMSQTLHL